MAIALFTNGAKGHSALQLSRDQYKTAFVLSHKLREATEDDQQKVTFAENIKKEVDGTYFGGNRSRRMRLSIE